MKEGDVNRETVIRVLCAHGVDVSLLKDTEEMWVIAKGNIIEVQPLKPNVSRRMLHHFQYKFEVPIAHFYNPHMILPATDKLC
jgi:hypothetical protein